MNSALVPNHFLRGSVTRPKLILHSTLAPAAAPAAAARAQTSILFDISLPLQHTNSLSKISLLLRLRRGSKQREILILAVQPCGHNMAENSRGGKVFTLKQPVRSNGAHLPTQHSFGAPPTLDFLKIFRLKDVTVFNGVLI